MPQRFAAAVLAVVTAMVLTPATATATQCNDSIDDVASTQPILGLDGSYALPDGPPTALVVNAHGYTHRSISWKEHMIRASRDHGAIAVTVDYRGTGPAPQNRGWPVRAGAEDLIAAAQYFVAGCDLQDVPVILYGVSMGANVSGYALTHGAAQPDGSPLFDHWIVVEGAVASMETYHGARALIPSGNSTAVEAVQDFEAECGGSFEEQPGCYADMHIVARTPDVVASGVQTVAMLHAFADGLVPYNQSRELATTLRAAGVPTEFTSIGRRNDWQNAGSAGEEGGTTADGYLAPLTGPLGADIRPFAGHGSEKSQSNIVVQAGLDRLWALIAGDIPSTSERFIDSELG